ncbi:F-box/kelch-repeat protein At3g06240-like [Papaver somniferum]|uniref:F-box/kelch-repeat protein At3g06240-like n=1 Tax=Papaver somniferum TaxID=3469 RepID=UPI000E701D7E|nr:F-box/kelch-repeat protein At3g06240-like [Papaver somniferum]
MDYASISSYSSLLDSSCECNGAVRMDYPLEYNQVDVLGSCNGLICMGISSDILGASMLCKDASICIWNPSTREYKKIPVHKRDFSLYSDNRCNRYGFGYDHIIDDYKLVRISENETSSCFEVEVYTLGSSTWSCTRASPYTFPYERRFRGLLFNGALHWLGVAVTQENSPEVIVSFDISSEKVLELPLLPEQTTLYQGNRKARRNLGTLGDCLCLVSNIPRIRTDIWVMRKYGVDASWTKQFTCSQQIIPKYLYSKPIWSLQNGEFLIDVDYGFV